MATSGAEEFFFPQTEALEGDFPGWKRGGTFQVQFSGVYQKLDGPGWNVCSSFAGKKQWRDHFGEKSTCQISWECTHLRETTGWGKVTYGTLPGSLTVGP